MRAVLSGVVLACLSLMGAQWGMGPGPGTAHTPPVVCSAISAWPMNEGSGLTLNDTSGNSNTATINSSGSVTWTANAIKSGVTSPVWTGSGFASSSNTTLTNFDGTTAISLSAWIKTSASPEQGLLSTLTGFSAFQGWEMEIAPTSHVLKFFLINNNSSGNQIAVTGSTALNDNALHYVVATYDGSRNASNVKLYVDGVLETPTIASNGLTATTANGNAPYIAARHGGGLPFTGAEGYAEIYNCVVSSTNVASNYAAGPGIY